MNLFFFVFNFQQHLLFQFCFVRAFPFSSRTCTLGNGHIFLFPFEGNERCDVCVCACVQVHYSTHSQLAHADDDCEWTHFEYVFLCARLVNIA